MDASAIIGLERVGDVGLLRVLLGRIHVTAEVAAEMRAGSDPTDVRSEEFRTWVRVIPARGETPSLGLGAGEASMIAAARKGDRLILDDAQARAVAEARGIAYTGLLGLLGAAVEEGKLSSDRALSVLDALVATDFRLSPELYAAARSILAGRR